MKALISAYACEPNVGSEPGVGWHWVQKAADLYVEVHVVTRSGDWQIGPDGRKYVRNSRKHIGAAMQSNDFGGRVQFHYFDLPVFISRWERTMVGDIINIYLWELLVFFFLRRRFRRQEFDVARKVTIVSHRYPSLVWYFSRCYIHGPIAGGERFPLRLLTVFSWKSRIKEVIRVLFQYLPWLDPLLWWTWSRADQIIAVTEETRSILPPVFRKKCIIEQAVAMEETGWEPMAVQLRNLDSDTPLRLLYVGRLLEWKGIRLALMALRKLRIPYQLDIIGDGPARSLLQAYAASHQLNVRFHGFIPRNELPAWYQASDLFVFPSLRDSGGFVVLEAQANGLPVLTLDLGGPQLNLDPETGILISTKQATVWQINDRIVREIERFHGKLSSHGTRHPQMNE